MTTAAFNVCVLGVLGVLAVLAVLAVLVVLVVLGVLGVLAVLAVLVVLPKSQYRVNIAVQLWLEAECCHAHLAGSQLLPLMIQRQTL